MMDSHVEETVSNTRDGTDTRAKKGRKRKAKNNATALVESKKVKKWKNKQRVLVFCARGVTYRARHLMTDLRSLIPHSRADTKLDRKEDLATINEICEMKNCQKCIFFEMRKKKDVYMWVVNTPNGPSAKFLVENIHTMDELKLTGNCLLGSRPILSFDPVFGEVPYLQLLKELFSQVFSTPYYHPKSKPFVDHTFYFGFMDNRIWFRNYQIVDKGETMTEIGPRFVLNPIKVFGGAFGGVTLYENPNFITPNAHRRMMRLEASYKYKNRTDARRSLAERNAQHEDNSEDPIEDVFQTSA